MQEINLYDLLKFYGQNWLNLLSAIFIGAIIGLVFTGFIQTPLYKSEATMLVVGDRSVQNTTINNNYTELFKSRLVLETVIDQQGYQGDYRQLSARTTATNDKNTDVLRVSIADPDAQKSEKLLSAALEAFKKQTGNIYDSSAENIKIVDTASTPVAPYNVSVLRQTGLAVAAAFSLAVMVLFFIYDYRTSQSTPMSKQKAAKKPVATAAAKATTKTTTKAKNTPKTSTKSKTSKKLVKTTKVAKTATATN